MHPHPRRNKYIQVQSSQRPARPSGHRVPLGSPRAAGQPAQPRPDSGEKVEVCLGEVGVDGGRGTKQDSGHGNGCHSYPSVAWGQGDHITGPAGALSPSGLCPPGAEAGRRSAAPSARPGAGLREEGLGPSCGLLPTRPEFPKGLLFSQRRSHHLEDTRQLSHYEALLFHPFRESM